MMCSFLMALNSLAASSKKKNKQICRKPQLISSWFIFCSWELSSEKEKDNKQQCLSGRLLNCSLQGRHLNSISTQLIHGSAHTFCLHWYPLSLCLSKTHKQSMPSPNSSQNSFFYILHFAWGNTFDSSPRGF